jgi:hypothetical protein
MVGREDGVLMVQLLQWATALNLYEAANAVFASDFNPESAHAADRAVGSLLTFGEGVATLVKHGLLDRDLVLDMWAISGVWEKLESVVRRERERIGEPKLYENFEALASGGL